MLIYNADAGTAYTDVAEESYCEGGCSAMRKTVSGGGSTKVGEGQRGEESGQRDRLERRKCGKGGAGEEGPGLVDKIVMGLS